MKGSCVPNVPGRPRIVKVIGMEVTLTWTQPDSDGGAEITGYLIAYIATDGSMIKRVTVGVTTTAKLNKNVSRGKSYVFAVAAMNALGCGDFSLLSEELKIPSYSGNKILILRCCTVNIYRLVISLLRFHVTKATLNVKILHQVQWRNRGGGAERNRSREEQLSHKCGHKIASPRYF